MVFVLESYLSFPCSFLFKSCLCIIIFIAFSCFRISTKGLIGLCLVWGLKVLICNHGTEGRGVEVGFTFLGFLNSSPFLTIFLFFKQKMAFVHPSKT